MRKKNTVFEKNLGTTQSIEIEEQNAWVYAWKHENKSKRKGIKVLLALWEKNIAKIWLKMTKNLSGALPSRRERGKFEKVDWTSQIWVFKKPDSRVLIDRKTVSIDRNRQRLVNFFLKFWLIEK